MTKNLTLVPLPHPHPVSELLKTYLAEEQSKRKSNSVEYDRVEEVTAGVKEYFDKSLGVMLLYKFERLQYKEMLAKTLDSGDVQWEGKTIADVYGAEHLSRLFGMLRERRPLPCMILMGFPKSLCQNSSRRRIWIISPCQCFARSCRS